VGDSQAHSALSLFQVTLQLRILCNHGTWQQPFSWAQGRLSRLDASEAGIEIALDEEGDVTCSICSEPFHISSCGSMYRRYSEICAHVICIGCLENLSGAEDSLPSSCPLCKQFSVNHRSHEKYFQANGESSKMEALMKDVVFDSTVWTTKR
jgi:SWI/SNF-related matrix-associated actin-dependent regulator of chromatin subfamily A3